MSETRKLAAILVADVVGYSRLAGADEDRTLARLQGAAQRPDRSDHRRPSRPHRQAHRRRHHHRVPQRGRRRALRHRSADTPWSSATPACRPDKRIEFRIGIHLGDVVEEADGDLMGDGVNIAARLEGIASPGRSVCPRTPTGKSSARLELAGHRSRAATQLKNIAEPVRAYSLQVGVARAGEARRQASLQRRRARGLCARWPALAAALVVALLAAGAYAWHAGLAPRLLGASVAEDKLATAPRLSIVVLPFENLSGDTEQDYFADGITDDLTTDLSHLPDSFVIARNTAFTYKGKAVDAKEIGRELGVRYVLEGSVRRLGEKVEVNAQLISTETGAHVWADRFEGERSKLGELQVGVRRPPRQFARRRACQGRSLARDARAAEQSGRGRSRDARHGDIGVEQFR